jgi:4-amino-4-deoxy-L-arabinose transferase-like glycosyltransferase
MFNNISQDKNLPFRLFTMSILILLTLPVLIQDGMFLDAMLYTCVSHNLSHGIGNFWFPQLSSSNFFGFPFFLEQPPLVFGIQSLFFRVLGDSMYVERFYTFLTTCITAILITRLWKDIFSNEKAIKELSWLPVLIWITIPGCIWSYSNNMMENSMAIFDLIAVILTLRALNSEKPETIKFFLAGLFIFLATFSKGVPGAFPLTIPFLHWVIFRKKSFSNIFTGTIILTAVPLVIYFILFQFPQSRESLLYYATKRLLVRINDSPTVTTRFFIVKSLFTELIPQLILAFIIITIAKLKKLNLWLISNRKRTIFFGSAGLAASMPLALTLVQRGFYLVPSFPYFAIAISLVIAPVIFYFKEYISGNKKLLMISSFLCSLLLVFSIALTLMQKGKSQRDKEMLHDVHAIGNNIPAKSEITVNQNIASNMVLECYFIRYYSISLYIDEPRQYLMVEKSTKPPDSLKFAKLNIATQKYDLFIGKDRK